MAPGDRLVTPRLVMRRWTDADLEPFAALNADPEVMRYFPARLTREDSDAFVDRIEARFDEDGYGLWALERAGGEFLGYTGLAPARADLPCAGAIEIGWRLVRAAWGHGYATEAAREAVRFGFEQAGLAEVVSFTAVVNVRSRRVMERLGMTRDPAEDFDHPALPAGSPLRPHVLYRLRHRPCPR